MNVRAMLWTNLCTQNSGRERITSFTKTAEQFHDDTFIAWLHQPYSGQLKGDQITNSTFWACSLAWKYTDKWLPTISFVMFSVFVLSLLLQILCHDMWSCQMFIRFCHGTHQGEEWGSVDLELHAMYTTKLIGYFTLTMIELIVVPFPPPLPNFFWFYSWTRLDYRESLDLPVPGSHEDDNWEFRVVSVPAASRKFLFPIPIPIPVPFPIPCFSSCPITFSDLPTNLHCTTWILLASSMLLAV